MPGSCFRRRFDSRPDACILLLVLPLLLAGCPAPDEPDAAPSQGTVITVGVLPDEAPARQRDKYDVLLDAIRRSSGMDVRLVIPGSYEDMLQMFANGDVDLAYFGGYTFTVARQRYGAEPLVMRDIDASFVSYVLVHADSDATELADLAGARFSFGARLSTSGHVMPRYFFSRLGLVPEELFGEVLYSNAHDRTFHWVAEGRVDAGVVNGQIARRMLASGSAPARSVRILWQSPPYVDYVWATQSSMPAPARRALMAAFLSLSADNPEHRRFLSDIGAGYFLPAAPRDFEPLSAAIRMLPAAALDGG